MAPDILVFTNVGTVPLVIPNPDPRYDAITIQPGEKRAIDATEDWAVKITTQIKSLIYKHADYESA